MLTLFDGAAVVGILNLAGNYANGAFTAVANGAYTQITYSDVVGDEVTGGQAVHTQGSARRVRVDLREASGRSGDHFLGDQKWRIAARSIDIGDYSGGQIHYAPVGAPDRSGFSTRTCG